MPEHVYVSDLSYALGEETSTVQEAVAAGMTRSRANVLEDAGFRRHHRCGAGTSAYALARRAVGGMHDARSRVDAIVYATCLPLNASVGDARRFDRSRDVKCLMDFPASRLQAELELADAITIGIDQQACTGIIGSLRVARGLLAAEPGWRRVLCITADRFPAGALYEQAYNLISDGAASAIVSREPVGFRLLGFTAITNGGLVQASDDEVAGVYFGYTHRLVHRALDQAGLTIRDIDWIVPQNMNRRALQILARLLDADVDRLYFETIGDVAHVISADALINLQHLEASGRLRRGDRLLLVMAGYGMHWQCAVLETA